MTSLRWIVGGLTLALVAIGACSSDETTSGAGATGPGASGGAGGGQAGAGGFVDPLTDTDGDTITDYQEGAELTDTNADGEPDYLDDDSDGDGIPDAIEAGDDDVTTEPVDSDDDGAPDFQDNDSDDDGIGDGDEDLDHDGVLDPGETDPRDPDSDDDGVSDLIEQVTGTDPLDPADNPEAQGNFVFLVPYQEPPLPPQDDLRFRTNIRKVDLYFLEDISISMDAELLAIHNNVVTMLDELTCDVGETPTSCATDCAADCGNDACDANEDATNCPQDCLGTCGDGFCIGNETPSTCDADCVAGCGDRTCDSGETVQNCPSDCTGTCGDGICHAGEQASITACIEDIQSGAGVFGTTSNSAACGPAAACAGGNETGNFVYRNLSNIQADAATTQTALPSDCWGSGCWEPGLAATFLTVKGWGTASAEGAGYVMPPLDVAEPAGCAAGYRGYPCFRPDSLPIILLIGDEAFSQCYLPAGPTLGTCASGPSTAMTTRNFHEVSDAVNDMGAKVIGIQGSSGGATLTADFAQLCTETGSFDAAGQPLVYQGADASAGVAIAQGVRDLAAGLPIDMRALIEDDATDDVNTIEAFVDFLETYTPATPECIDWADRLDNEPDGHDDEFLGVTPGLPVCWMIHVKQNETVPPLETVQIFKATIWLRGNDTIDLDQRTAYFVVPPDISTPIPR